MMTPCRLSVFLSMEICLICGSVWRVIVRSLGESLNFLFSDIFPLRVHRVVNACGRLHWLILSRRVFAFVLWVANWGSPRHLVKLNWLATALGLLMFVDFTFHHNILVHCTVWVNKFVMCHAVRLLKSVGNHHLFRFNWTLVATVTMLAMNTFLPHELRILFVIRLHSTARKHAVLFRWHCIIDDRMISVLNRKAFDSLLISIVNIFFLFTIAQDIKFLNFILAFDG